MTPAAWDENFGAEAIVLAVEKSLPPAVRYWSFVPRALYAQLKHPTVFWVVKQVSLHGM